MTGSSAGSHPSQNAATQKGPATLATQPSIILNSGVELPGLGFGVFQTPPDVTQAAVEEALRVGYGMVDTAAAYLNEREVGAAIAASGVQRSELFVQTKMWVSDYGYDAALHAFDVSTRKLRVDYVDLTCSTSRCPRTSTRRSTRTARSSGCSTRDGRGRSGCPTSARATGRPFSRGSRSCPR